MQFLVYLRDHTGEHIQTVVMEAESREQALRKGWIYARREFPDIDVCQVQAKEN